MKKIRFNSVDFSRLRKPLFKSGGNGIPNLKRGVLNSTGKKIKTSKKRATRIIFASSSSTFKVNRLKELRFKVVLART